MLRQRPVTNILQIHPGTGSGAGTIQGLTRLFRVLAEKIRSGQPLAVEEQPYAGYDAVQLLPVEPTIEYESGPGFWDAPDPAPAPESEDHWPEPEEGPVTVTVRRPDMTKLGLRHRHPRLLRGQSGHPRDRAAGRAGRLRRRLATTSRASRSG